MKYTKKSEKERELIELCKLIFFVGHTEKPSEHLSPYFPGGLLAHRNEHILYTCCNIFVRAVFS